MTTEITKDGHVWCPLCEDYVQLLSIQKAARLVGVSQKTVYRYIEASDVYAIKVAGHTYRICANCLIKPLEN